jgi:hypothetical protein
MAYVSHALSPSVTPSTRTVTPARPSFFTRFIRAMQASRMRQAEREIALYLGRTGGKLTDSVEREIERRFLARDNHWQRK